MSLSVKTRTSGNVAIVDLQGRITLGEPTGLLRDTVKSILAGGIQEHPAESWGGFLHR